MTTRISSKGQIVLPAALRKRDGIEAGDQFKVKRIDRGEYRLRLKELQRNKGMVDWLLTCPSKGYFIPFHSATTDLL